MKKLFFLLLLTSFAFGQSINNYKYAVVPAKFDFFKSPDQFGLNTLTKQFLEKEGFVVFFDNEIISKENAEKSCDKLYVDVTSKSSMFRTKVQVILKDCRNAVIFTSDEGESRDKDQRVAYNQALRSAFKSLTASEYKFSGVETAAQANEKAVTIIKEDFNAPASDILNAQPITNGFQLVDTTPKVVLKILKTSNPDVFVAVGSDGIVTRKGGNWIFEYYELGQLKSRPLNIKF